MTAVAVKKKYLEPPEIIVIRGDSGDLAEWRDQLGRIYAPSRVLLAIGRDEEALPGLLAERKPLDGETVAYRCIGTHCELPVTSLKELGE